MLNISASRNQFQTLNSDLNDALLVYERRFGYTPDWLEDFTHKVECLL